ncbi:MAG TPA: glycosyltransferase family 2 protein [Chitinophagaceae bacterium]|nr:glycosyltransferase family 2 protein [Chitinophagaceae bacterium]
MQQLSVVIICKNEADIIDKTLQSLDGLCDDIIVYDNGSTDNTLEQIKKFNVHLQQGTWEGFGQTKNKAIALAKYDWILSLDADEAIDDELKRSLLALNLTGENDVYEIKFKNFLGNKHLKYGEWGGDKHIRLFNRKKTKWNDASVHEELLMPPGMSVEKLNGYILHQTMKDINDYAAKMVRYAMLNAEKYYRQGKRSSFFKIRIAPGLSFVHYFILKLGFLDGYAGYVCARMTSYYTFLKYARLRELNRQSTMGNGQ